MAGKNVTGVESVIRILQKNTRMLLPKRNIYRALAAIVILCIMIPCVLVVGFMSFVMTQALNEVNNPVGGVLFEMQLLSAFSMVFGIMVIFSVLFFSSDREHFVTLPIPSQHLMMAKFLYAYVAESAMEFFVLIAVFAGYFIAMGEIADWKSALHPVSLVAALLGTVLIPMVPMIYCAIFGLILMASLKRVKSIKTFYRMSGAFLVAFVLLFLYSLQDIGKINMENYVEALGSGRDVFLSTLNKIFFPVPWLAKALDGANVLYVLLYLLANIFLLLILYIFGILFYQEGLYTAAALGSEKKVGIKSSDIKESSAFRESLRKEMRVLLRTRAFSANCVYVNLIWPLGTFLLFYFAKDEGTMADFIRLYREGKDRANMTLTLVVISIAFIATALNSIASTAFTREGQHLSLIQFIPVPYRTQLYAKAAVSTLFTYPCLLLTDIILCFFVGVSVPVCVLYAILMLLAHLIAVISGMYLDSAAPYVQWDDEYSALRSNRNTFFNMAVVMLLAAVFVEIGFLLFEVALVPVWVFYTAMTTLLGFTFAGTIFWGEKKIIRNMERM